MGVAAGLGMLCSSVIPTCVEGVSQSVTGNHRYYRDPEQPAPALEEVLEDAGAVAKPQRVALDPEALLREAEEGVENLDEVHLCTIGLVLSRLCAHVHAVHCHAPSCRRDGSRWWLATSLLLVSAQYLHTKGGYAVQIGLLDLKGLRRLINFFERRVRVLRLHGCTRVPRTCALSLTSSFAFARVIRVWQFCSVIWQFCSVNGSGVRLGTAKHALVLMELQLKDNMEMRMKYAEEPGKFMESEVDLDDAVKRMMVVAGSPELYPDFARTQVLRSRCGCPTWRRGWKARLLTCS